MSMESDVISDKLAGKPPKPEPKPEPKPAPPEPDEPVISETVTYLPGPEDPVKVEFVGQTFHANLPKNIAMKQSFFERLKGNKFFKVGAFDPNKDGVVVAEQPVEPRTSEQYKAYAVAWFKTTDNLHEFDERWVAEEQLRRACNFGGSDLDYLFSLAQPKRGELKKKLRP